MSRMLKFFAIAVVLFSLAAGASWFLQGQGQAPTKEDDEKTAKSGADGHRGKGTIHEGPAPRTLPRVPVSPEAERITAFAANLEKQQESLKNREQHLAVREKQLDLIHEEIKKDQKKLDAVRKEIDSELHLVQEKLDLLEKRAGEGAKEREKVEAKLEEVRGATLELGGIESKNLRQVAGIYDKMDAEAAAQSIQQMAEQGKLDTAVSILAAMRDRQAANVLGELSKQDSTIAVQLFDRMRFLKTPGNGNK
jgi:flagellar motility protein MotE (MotC chaperone)